MHCVDVYVVRAGWVLSVLLTNQNVARGEWPGRLVWKYKIVKHDPVDYWTCLPVCLRNQVLIMLPIMTVGPYFGLAFQAGTR